MIKRLLLAFLTCLFVALHVASSYATVEEGSPKILILNSYHLGYLWSDGEVNGIESTIFRAFPDARITVEHMDTKRIPAEKSFDKLFSLYLSKYREQQFDLILSVDDNALRFLKKYRGQLFGDVPVVFCGVNNFKPEKTLGMEKVTGVTEIHRIEDNFKLLLNLHPSLKKVVVLTDVTPSGQISLQEVKAATPSFAKRLAFEYVEGLPLPQLKDNLSRLDSDTVVFLLNYFRDKEGNYYSPEGVMPEISEASSVPVYCFSEFYMNHGATGGLINEGYPHGALAGQIALKVLGKKDISKMPVVEGPMRPVFDHRQLKRFYLDSSSLPHDAQVLNIKEKDQKEILILHSYEPEYSWTANELKGMKEVLGRRNDISEIFVEFMDTKRYSNPAYYHQLYELYKTKYAHRQIDVVLVADDNAFDFARKFGSLLFRNTPIVFCGVNFMEDLGAVNQENITGVVESLDLVGTIETILAIHPETEKILVINDSTTTGLQMKKDLEKNIPKIKNPPHFEYISHLPMKDLLKHLKNQGEKTVVLVLSFFRDGRNAQYPIKTSIRMITEAGNLPVYGIIESYLNYGIVGGSFVLGKDQGTLAAGLATRILDGKPAGDIPILRKHPYHFIFDDNVLKRFHIPKKVLPATSIIINPPTGFYYKYKHQVDLAVFLFLLLLSLVIFQQFRIRNGEKKKREIESEARTDGLTGTIQRKYFIPEVTTQLEKCLVDGKKLTLCYGDINNLKSVNDNFGHQEGDRYIVTMVDLILSTIRANDRIYRMGGDEFMIVFVDCGADGTKNRIEDIREKLVDLNKKPDSRYEKGMSFGCAEFDPANPKSLDSLLVETDERMYLDKSRQGLPEKKVLAETG